MTMTRRTDNSHKSNKGKTSFPYYADVMNAQEGRAA